MDQYHDSNGQYIGKMYTLASGEMVEEPIYNMYYAGQPATVDGVAVNTTSNSTSAPVTSDQTAPSLLASSSDTSTDSTSSDDSSLSDQLAAQGISSADSGATDSSGNSSTPQPTSGYDANSNLVIPMANLDGGSANVQEAPSVPMTQATQNSPSPLQTKAKTSSVSIAGAPSTPVGAANNLSNLGYQMMSPAAMKQGIVSGQGLASNIQAGNLTNPALTQRKSLLG